MISRLSFRGTLNEADLLPVARYAVWHRSPALKIMFCGGCFLVLVGIASLAVGQTGNAIVPLLLGSFYTAYLFVLPKLSIKKQLKASAHVSEEGTYAFDDVQFSIARPSLQVSMPWSNIHSAVEMKDLFAIFTTKTCFYSIPKRFLAADQLASFRELLEQVLQEKWEATQLTRVSHQWALDTRVRNIPSHQS